MTFAEVLKKNAAEFSSFQAVVWRTLSLSFDELNNLSDIFAVRLIAQGVKPGDHVALRAASSTQWIIAFFGIVKAGAVAVLLDGNLKSWNMLDFLKMTDAKFILYGKAFASNSAIKLAQTLNLSDNSTLCIDRVNMRPVTDAELDPVRKIASSANPNDTAVIVFSAGTTGPQKAVMLSQKALCHAALSLSKSIEALQADCFCQTLALSSSFGLTLALQCLLSARTLAISDTEAPKDIIQCISQNNVNALIGTASAMQNLLEHPGLTQKIVRQIRVCCIDGGFATPKQLLNMELAFGNAKIINGYGLAETCAYVAIPDVSEDVHERADSTGKVLDDTHIAIFYPEKGVVPDGEIGEIVVNGPSLMNGYYPKDNDNSPIDASGWLHTGDLGYLKNGKLFYMGRISDIIVKNNEWILPAYIENVILNIPMIANVKVIGAPNTETGNSVEACVILNAGYKLDEKVLRNELSKKLPPHMIPEHFFVFDAFPKNALGKLDLNGLRDSMLNRVRAEVISKDLMQGIHAGCLTIRSAEYMIVPVVSFLETLVTNLGLSPAKVQRISHATEELLTERISNAFGDKVGEISIEVVLMSRGVRLYFRDSGEPFSLENSDATTAKIVMGMVDNFISAEGENGKPCFALDFFYDKDSDIDAYLLEHGGKKIDED